MYCKWITGVLILVCSCKESHRMFDFIFVQYGTKQTMDAMEKAGHNFSVLHACGGITKNTLFVQTTADVIGINK